MKIIRLELEYVDDCVTSNDKLFKVKLPSLHYATYRAIDTNIDLSNAVILNNNFDISTSIKDNKKYYSILFKNATDKGITLLANMTVEVLVR